VRGDDLPFPAKTGERREPNAERVGSGFGSAWKRQVRNFDPVDGGSLAGAVAAGEGKAASKCRLHSGIASNEFRSFDPGLPKGSFGEQRKQRSAFLNATFRLSIPVGERAATEKLKTPVLKSKECLTETSQTS
jgi:hypothetical protein